MQLKVLFDKVAQDRSLKTGWGVSFLADGKILFDTGEDGSLLEANLRSLGIGIAGIEAVVISHDHWDHTGGLWDLLAAKAGLKVYACANFSSEFKEKVREVKGELIELSSFTDISEDIFASGEIAGEYQGRFMPEQALALKTRNGLTVVTGCAHPGIIKILESVKKQFPSDVLYLAIGGFHLMKESRAAIAAIADKFREMGVKKAAPTHCSGRNAENIFKKKYADDFIAVRAGQTLKI